MTRGDLKALNNATMINAMSATAGITPGISEACESADDSFSPPHSKVKPGGTSMASSFSPTLLISVGKVTPGIGLA